MKEGNLHVGRPPKTGRPSLPLKCIWRYLMTTETFPNGSFWFRDIFLSGWVWVSSAFFPSKMTPVPNLFSFLVFLMPSSVNTILCRILSFSSSDPAAFCCFSRSFCMFFRYETWSFDREMVMITPNCSLPNIFWPSAVPFLSAFWVSVPCASAFWVSVPCTFAFCVSGVVFSCFFWSSSCRFSNCCFLSWLFRSCISLCRACVRFDFCSYDMPLFDGIRLPTDAFIPAIPIFSSPSTVL